MGAIGAVHADAYRACPEADLTAICDVSSTRLDAEAQRLAISQHFTDYRELLRSDVDAVSVCVGNALHREVAVAALKAGKHILLEKPMAMNAGEAAVIVAAGRRARKIIQIGMVNRQRAEVQLARDYVTRGLLGQVYHIHAMLIRRRGIPGLGGWFTTKSMSGGGPLIDIGVHWFDAAMYVSGLWKPTRVSAMNYAKFGAPLKDYKYVDMWAGPPKFNGVFDVEDYSTGFVRFGKKATMDFNICWAANAEDRGFIEILGDKGGLRMLEGKPLALLTEHQGRLANITPQYKDVNTFQVQIAKFIAACRGLGKPAATAEEGLTVMKLLDAVYASSRLGKEVEIFSAKSRK